MSSSKEKESFKPFSFKSHFNERKLSIEKNHKYILDLFEINNIYYEHEVSLSGIVREYEETYALVAVKVLETLQDILCITVLKTNLNSHN